MRSRGTAIIDDISEGEYFIGRAALVIAIVALVAVFVLPAALKSMLLVVCISCLYGAWLLWRKKLSRPAVTAVGVAVLFNPIFPLSVYIAIHAAPAVHAASLLILRVLDVLAIAAVISAYLSLPKQRA